MAFDPNTLMARRDQRIGDQYGLEDTAIDDPTNPFRAQDMYARDFGRGREEAAMGPGGYNRNWVPFFESLSALGKPVRFDTNSMTGIPWGSAPTMQRDRQTMLPVSLQALNDAAPVVRGPTVSQGIPLREQPVPTTTAPAAPGKPTSAKGVAKPNTAPLTMPTQPPLGSIPKASLPSRDVLPPGSLMSLRQLAYGGY